MPKTIQVPLELKLEIRKFHASNPEVSARKIGKQFGLHHKTVSKIIVTEAAPFASSTSATPELTEKSELNDDTWTITLPKTRIQTLEELVAHMKIDLVLWEVVRWTANKWEMAYTVGEGKDKYADTVPLFQVKAFLKKRKEVEAARGEIEALKKIAKEHAPYPLPVFGTPPPSDLMLELNMPDVHFGKMAWGIETGSANYDVKIAEAVYWAAFETILERLTHRSFEKILFVVGNDLLNTDDVEGRTTSGTYVSTDARYHKTFSTVRDIMIKAIERLRQIAPIKVVIVSGNHDQLSCWHLGDSLECFFSRYEDVEIDNLPRMRKYHEHGNVMLMLTHGHKGKHGDYPLVMATEQPTMWGNTKFREAHVGHKHLTKLDEHHGVRIRTLSALCATDDWHSQNFFTGNLRNAEGFVWSAKEGLVEQVYYTVPE